jgi:hypothetical protein
VDTLINALAGSLPAQVDFAATVTSRPHCFVGSRTHARHEAFTVRTDSGTALEIVDNIDLAPPIVLDPGDRVSVRGELVASPGHLPVVHWTHHDPARRHPDGWIDFAGRRYA